MEHSSPLTAFTPDMFMRNFAEAEPALTHKGALDESNRCLYCYDAPCIKACPTSINIPSFIKRIATDNLKGSAQTIMNSNPVGASCARVCPTDELCEGACVLNDASAPIQIGLLQRYATDWAMNSGVQLFKAGTPNGKKVAVIGGGPAGLSAARELAREGFAVVIYEAKALAGGLDTHGIVSFRLPQSVSLWEVEQVGKLGVEIRTGVKVGVDVSVDELKSNYDAIVLAAGMGYVPPIGIEGEKMAGVYDAIALVESTKTGIPLLELMGQRVAVIGAGNTAIDAATCSVRLGATNVKMVYRRTREEMTAYDFEYEFAKQEGVEFSWLTLPKRIVGDELGNVTALECVQMKLTEELGKDGRPIPMPIEGSEFLIPVDAVVIAIGQKRRLDLIDSLGLMHDRGVVKVDEVTCQTSDPQIYAAGDIIFGSGKGEAMVVSAAQQGKDAAHAIVKQFSGHQEVVVRSAG
ncbi:MULTISPECIES: NAD(P)-dependent oxidoreductase [Paenibacillus]|jgi:dihydropyrimidine dehydrogenase (NAD+) subunit PreT|uniref:Dihydropyrimidine dehydrogenase n=1 Tax=Paenibacillus odorifer TaxID=189426 RepID=A0ABX3GM79_9BACL|nr:NAD(P)-dependent oxidoreductase [Paenibacillus odorifer]OMC77449.1 dihydropyrimidine dehydrogenase [Paenibacillus odorifer]OMD33113.1 dihydropyrimidine dehydrogenase [Paenibacillus odorifer]